MLPWLFLKVNSENLQINILDGHNNHPSQCPCLKFWQFTYIRRLSACQVKSRIVVPVEEKNRIWLINLSPGFITDIFQVLVNFKPIAYDTLGSFNYRRGVGAGASSLEAMFLILEKNEIEHRCTNMWEEWNWTQMYRKIVVYKLFWPPVKKWLAAPRDQIAELKFSQDRFTRSNFGPIIIWKFFVYDGKCWRSRSPVFPSNYFVINSKETRQFLF